MEWPASCVFLHSAAFVATVYYRHYYHLTVGSLLCHSRPSIVERLRRGRGKAVSIQQIRLESIDVSHVEVGAENSSLSGICMPMMLCRYPEACLDDQKTSVLDD